MKFRSLLASCAVAIFVFAGAAFAEKTAPVKDLTPWIGEYISAETYWADARTDGFYAAIGEEAEKEGKDLTAAEAKAKMVMMYHALFTTAEVDAEGITFTMKDEGNRLHVDYEYKGPITDTDGGEWYLFTAKEVTAENSQLANLVLTGKHGNPEHFHFRNGDVSGQELVKDPVYANWWGTLMEKNLSYEDYMKGKNAKNFLKYAM